MKLIHCVVFIILFTKLNASDNEEVTETISNSSSNSFTHLLRSIKTNGLKKFNALSHFISDISHPPPFEKAIQLHCANSTTKQFEQVFLNNTDIKNKLDLTKELGFVLHGWLNNGAKRWVIELSEKWLNISDTNVCRVNWSRLAQAEYTLSATRNVRIVAGYLIDFIEFLRISDQYPMENITMIGHSLGAHISGIVGNRFEGKFKKIVGLDPAGPLFIRYTSSIVPDRYRLDRSDARQVIVMHSCGDVLGTGKPIGHQDYYGNQGKCKLQANCCKCRWIKKCTSCLKCAHSRATRYFIETMDKPCLAVRCESYTEFSRGWCGNVTNQIGMNAKMIEGQYYFSSGGTEPNCI